MSLRALITRRRSLAAVAALLFTLLMLAAAAPHEHGGMSGAPASGLSAAAASFDAPGGCPLCDWLASPRLSLPAHCLVLWTGGLLPLLFPPLLSALFFSPSPHSRSRGPPILTP